MRTLVISDLHLGSLLDRDVLRRPQALAILEARVAQVDRLILLGDTLELLEGRPLAASDAARPVLTTLGRALGSSGQVVVIPGNHDHALIRDWLTGRLRADRPLRLDSQVPRTASELLDELCSWLAPATVEVRYPGIWLGDGIYAMHGHYGDRHLLDALAWWGGDEPPRQTTVSDYEQAPGADRGAMTELVAAAMPDQLTGGLELGAGLLRQSILRSLPIAARLPGADNLAAAAAVFVEQGIHRRAFLPAIAEVTARLRIPANTVIFGHIHRRGPLPDDPEGMWTPAGSDGPTLLNSGSWVYDSALVRPTGAGRSAYRPGGAVLIEDGKAPRCLDLLAGVSDEVLRGQT